LQLPGVDAYLINFSKAKVLQIPIIRVGNPAKSKAGEKTTFKTIYTDNQLVVKFSIPSKRPPCN
jgi:hypothetical protein